MDDWYSSGRLLCFELCFELWPSSDVRYGSFGVGGSGSGERGTGGVRRASGVGVEGWMISAMSNSLPGLRRGLERAEGVDGGLGNALTLLPLPCRVKASAVLLPRSTASRSFFGGRYSASASDGMGGASGLIENRSSLYAP